MAAALRTSPFGNDSQKKEIIMIKKINSKSMVYVDIACTILFTLFSLVYLSFFQADLLWYAQHVLSHGVTVYSTLVGAIVITLTALLIRAVAKRFHPANQRVTPSLSFMPSALFLAIITDFHVVSDTQLAYGNAIVFSILLFVAYVLMVWFVAKINPFDQNTSTKGWTLNMVMMNIVTLCFVFTTIGMLCNHNRSEHLKLRAERMIVRGDCDGALELLKYHCEKDSTLVMLRAYALGKHTVMGENFFSYFHKGSSELLMPAPANRQLLVTTSSAHIHRMVGGTPGKGQSVKSTLQLLAKRKRLTKTGRHYLLVAHLLDRDIDAFANCLATVYEMGDRLPRQYAEAMVLYMKKHPHANVYYDLGDAEQRYEEFRKLADPIKKGATNLPNGNPVMYDTLMKPFGDTYWYYYV